MSDDANDDTGPVGSGDDVVRLAGLPAGVSLLAGLISLDVSSLDAHDSVSVVQAWERLARFVAGAQLAVLAGMPGLTEYQACAAGDSTDGHVHDAIEPVGDEVSLALTISPARGRSLVACALDLANDLPDTFEALAGGRIDAERARLIAERTRCLDPAARQVVETTVLPRAEQQTRRQLERSLARAVLAVDARAAEDRRELATADRRVEAPCPDAVGGVNGMARMYVVGPAEDVVALHTALDAAARHRYDENSATGDERTLAQLRFDLLTDIGWNALDLGHLGCCNPSCASPAPIGTAGSPATSAEPIASREDTAPRLVRVHGRAAVVNVTVPFTSLLTEPDSPGPAAERMQQRFAEYRARLGVNHSHPPDPNAAGHALSTSDLGRDRASPRQPLPPPAELDGFGPVTATAARRVLDRGMAYRILTDPVGRPLAYASKKYRPSTELAEHVVLRDVTCRFPTCSVPARVSDLDHRLPWRQGGATEPANLWALHRGHHFGKTHHRFRIAADTMTGELCWITPAGHRYPVHPDLQPLIPQAATTAEPQPPERPDPPPF